MYCKYCGNLIENGDVFCSACGAQLNRVQPSQFSAPANNVAATVKKATLALIFAIVSISLLLGDIINLNIFDFGSGFRYFFGFCFAVPALVLGIIGHCKKHKYGTLSMYLGIGALVLFFIVIG